MDVSSLAAAVRGACMSKLVTLLFDMKLLTAA